MIAPTAISDLPLRDIHMPAPIGWWPPAPGWWLLALIIAALCFMTARWFIKQHKRRTVYRSASRELEQIKARYQQDRDGVTLSQRLSVLLRRVAMSVTSRNTAAGLTGERWLNYLDRIIEEPCFNTPAGRLLIEAPYQASSDINGDALLGLCTQWVNKTARRRTGQFARKELGKKAASERTQHA